MTEEYVIQKAETSEMAWVDDGMAFSDWHKATVELRTRREKAKRFGYPQRVYQLLLRRTVNTVIEDAKGNVTRVLPVPKKKEEKRA